MNTCKHGIVLPRQPDPKIETAERIVTVRELLRLAAAELASVQCDSPRLDAELLLTAAWEINRTDLIIRANEAVPAVVADRFQRMLQRRREREPLAYILGEKEFWSRQFSVSPDVLIPRPETEHLIESALRHLPDRRRAWQICDIGTGSGCIAVTLACEYPEASVTASDISAQALAIAQRNAAMHAVDARMHFRQGNLFAALEPNDGPFDLIISNPPYVAAAEMDALEPELSREPRHALTDEADGLSLLAAILQEGISLLKPGGWIMLETGLCGLPPTPDQFTLVEEVCDLAGHLRCGIYQHICQSDSMG